MRDAAGPLPAVLDHVAVAVERWTDAWPRYLGDLGAVWVAAGRGPGFAPSQMRYPHPERTMKVEVLEPHAVDQDDFLRRFLDRNGPGPHHLTFKVPDLAGGLDVVRAHGYDPIGVDLSQDGWKESFIHPKQACGIVVQIAQAAGEMPSELDPPDIAPRGAPATLTEVVLLVADLDAGLALFAGLLGGEPSSRSPGEVVLDWPGGGRLRLVQPTPGSGEAAWLGSRPGRVSHIGFAVDDPASLPGAVPVGEGAYEIPAAANHGTCLLLEERP